MRETVRAQGLTRWREYAFFTLFLAGSLAILGASAASRAATHREWRRPVPHVPAGPVSTNEIWTRLRAVVDAELGIDVVDLGLVYSVTSSRPGHVAVVMTLTTKTCPYGKQLVEDVGKALLSSPSVNEAEVRVTFEPPWSWERMPAEARRRVLEGPRPEAWR